LEFQYFDGTNWTESWDSTQLGGDGMTPLGSPRAIAVKIGIRVATGKNKNGELKYFRQVFAISSANGSTQMQPPAGSSNTPTNTSNPNAQLSNNGQ
jgi:hypothetical protein